MTSMSHLERPPPPPAPVIAYAVRNPAETDQSHLRTLAICHWVLGGLACLGGCFGLLYIAMGIAALSGNMNFGPPGSPTSANEAKFFGIFFVTFGCLMSLIVWSLAGLTIYSGFCLQRRRKRTFSIVIAAIQCMFFPFGTLLGVFTIIVLARDSVRHAYDLSPAK